MGLSCKIWQNVIKKICLEFKIDQIRFLFVLKIYPVLNGLLLKVTTKCYKQKLAKTCEVIKQDFRFLEEFYSFCRLIAKQDQIPKAEFSTQKFFAIYKSRFTHPGSHCIYLRILSTRRTKKI